MAIEDFSPEQQMYIAGNKLDPETLEQTIQTILARSTETKTPSLAPVAFIVGGQPGSGKSGIITNIMQNHGTNFILVDNDEYRMYHPNVNEINQVHPEIYTECTDQLSFAATPRAIEHARANGYNMIIHQTLKNDTIINCAITDLTNSDYARVIVVMAADEMTSNEGMLRRCQDNLEYDGTCRWVPQENHDFAYKGLPTTVGHIEERGLYDAIVVVTRSNDPKHPENVNVIHKVFNPNMSEHHRRALEAVGFGGAQIISLGSAKDAVIAGREMDGDKTLDKLEEKIKTAKSRATTPEEFVRIRGLEKLFSQGMARRVAKQSKNPSNPGQPGDN